MYKLLDIEQADDNKHKYKVRILNEKTNRIKTIKFGSYDMMDFILWNKKEGKEYAEKRKELYINRHKKEDWTDITKAGFYSRYVLWNKPTLQESLKDMKIKFNQYNI